MKKRYAWIMTAVVLTGMMTATALAEGPGMDGGMQMGAPQMPGGTENGQAPQMSENGQAPQMSENGQAPQMAGKGPENNFGVISFENYVTDGTISQETYDAITKYMEENKPELPEGMTESEKPELPEGATEGERPELPQGAAMGERPEMKEGEGPDLLKDLLEDSVITQEEYDALAAARAAHRPELPAATQKSASSQTTEESSQTTEEGSSD